MADEKTEIFNSQTPQWIDCSTLFVDPRYQRDRNEGLINRIANELDPDLIGALLVSQRNGTEGGALLDGQQRHAALCLLGYDAEHQRVPAVVLTGLTPQREAHIFRLFNQDRRQVTVFEKWKARMFEGEPTAQAITKMLNGLGLYVAAKSNDRNPDSIRCIGTLEIMWDRAGATYLTQVLRIIKTAWPTDITALDRDIIHAMTMVVLTHQEMDEKLMIRRLQSVDPHGLMRRATTLRDSHGENMATWTAFTIVEQYNRRTPQASQLKPITTGAYGAEMRFWLGGVRQSSIQVKHANTDPSSALARSQGSMLRARAALRMAEVAKATTIEERAADAVADAIKAETLAQPPSVALAKKAVRNRAMIEK